MFLKVKSRYYPNENDDAVSKFENRVSVPIKICQGILEVAREDWSAVIHDADESLELLLSDGSGFGCVECIECDYSTSIELRNMTPKNMTNRRTLQNLVPRVHAVEYGCVYEFFIVDLQFNRDHATFTQ